MLEPLRSVPRSYIVFTLTLQKTESPGWAPGLLSHLIVYDALRRIYEALDLIIRNRIFDYFTFVDFDNLLLFLFGRAGTLF